MDNYIEIINEYINSTDKSEKNLDFYNKLFFTYPSKCLELEKISKIISAISKKIKIPYHDIKVIGSSHLGFSLVKPKDQNKVKFFDKQTSDIDIAIINKELFYHIFMLNMKSTSFYTDLVGFIDKRDVQYCKKNMLKGFIRPDKIGDKNYRTKWLRFFEDISQEYDIKISAAIYLDEECLHNRLESSFKIYSERMGFDGIK